MDMDQETSKRLFKEGGTFLFLDVPVGTSIGIDMQSWNSGDKFKGIKMIPPGLHFIHYAAVNKYGNEAPRTGFFHFFNKEELLVEAYDPQAEDMRKQEITEEIKNKMRNSLEELDKNLGPYPYEHWRTWVSLSNRITPELLSRLNPPRGKITSAPELTLDEDQTPTVSNSKKKLTTLEEAESRLPKMTENPEAKIRFTDIPTKDYPDTATPQEITKHILDKSYKFECIIETYSSPNDFLGELQFSFLCFLVGQNYDAFEHWKELVRLICYSESTIVKYPSLYTNLLSDLYFQSNQVPNDFFQDIVTSNNFLFHCYQRLFQNLKGQDGIESKLRLKAERFEKFLSEKFGWDFEFEDEDEAPVIVE